MIINIADRRMIMIGNFISSGETSFGLRRAEPDSDTKRSA
jgi:hypothetical protein